jgi:hypothetical protein
MKTAILIMIAIILLTGIGWTKNLVKLTNCDFKPSYKCEVIHTVGLLPPVGLFTGWVNVGN